MRTVSVLLCCVVFALTLLSDVALGRNIQGRSAKFRFIDMPREPLNSAEIGASMFQTAAATTVLLAWYQFDTPAGLPTKQGWVEHDMTGQLATYWHVDGIAPCNSIPPINGTKSMWCGQWATTADPWCGWGSLPGYGNNWDQSLATNVGNTVNSVTYTIRWDSEPGYDFTYVEWWDPVNLVWVADPLVNGGTGSYTSGPANGDPGGPQTETSTSTFGSTKMRFHFASDLGWSGEDGLWPTTDTPGAVVLDDLTINNNPATFEDWEGEACGAKQSADAKWIATVPAGFGLYAALHSAATVVQEDPCAKPLSHLWGFFDNPAVTNYACGGWPLQGAMPYGPDDNGLYFWNEVRSPWIPISGTGSSYVIEFLTYGDLPIDNLQFSTLAIRTKNVNAGGCPGMWRGRDLLIFGGSKAWGRVGGEFGFWVSGTDTHIQVALGALDMCGVWCGIMGSGACHSHAPLLDQVKVMRAGVVGPQWDFVAPWKDNFPEEGGVGPGAFARCDMGGDILVGTNPNTLPGDSMTVGVADPVGLANDATGGRARKAVYAFVRVTDRFGTLKAGKSGFAIQSPDNTAYAMDPDVGLLRWPLVASVSPMGWDAYRFDYSYTAAGGRVKDGFCCDLMDLGSGPTGPHYKHAMENVAANIGIFEPGDVISYVLAAKNTQNQWSYMYRTFDDQGGWVRTSDLAEALASPCEWSVLPDAGRLPGDQGDILFVNNSGGPARLFFDWAFQYLGLTNRVDRFDGGGLASRVKNIQNQMIGDPVEIYQKVIWNCGGLSEGMMGSSQKSDDFDLCYQFFDQHPDNPGWAYWGDNVVTDWSNLIGGGAVNVKSVYMNHVLVNDDQRLITGIISPKVEPVAASPWVSETFWASGGCPDINSFDAVNATGTLAAVSHRYWNHGVTPGVSAPAAVYQATPNSNGTTARFHLAGFGYDFIRDDDAASPPDRVNFLKYTLQYFENVMPTPIGIDPVAFANTLEDNYPNPFNPTTTIRYSIAEHGQVTLKIYNAAGQLVRTLVKEEQVPQAGGFAKVWNGLNDQGQSVASGVYFYQLTAKNFEQTKKLVVLK